MLHEPLAPCQGVGPTTPKPPPAIVAATALILNDGAMQALARAVATVLNARRTIWEITGTRPDGKEDDTISDAPGHHRRMRPTRGRTSNCSRYVPLVNILVQAHGASI